MKANKAKGTGPELLLRKAIWRQGIRGYRLNPRGIPGRPDICFKRIKLAVFVHGCFWHRCPSCTESLPKTNTGFWARKFELNVERDRAKATKLKDMGWEVLTIWECALSNDLQSQVRLIEDAILNQRA